MDHQLVVYYNQARALIQRIASSDSIGEVKGIADQAAAIGQFARLAHDPELEQWVTEIRIRASRRIGQLTSVLPKATGANLPNVADPRRTGKRDVLKLAGISKDVAHRCEKVARLDEKDFENFISRKRAAGETITADEAVKAVAKQAHKCEVVERVDKPNVLCLADLGDLSRRGQRFGTIYADPPWQYNDQDTRGATSDHYRGMPVDEIAALPVAPLAAAKAHLHLWTTNGFLFEARKILERWGFEYTSCFVWVKPQMGMGHYWRVSHEFLLLGVRGGCGFGDHSLKSWGEFDRREHSTKPAEVRALIERASPGPRLELFGRRPEPGWLVWGNEIDRTSFDAAAAKNAA